MRTFRPLREPSQTPSAVQSAGATASIAAWISIGSGVKSVRPGWISSKIASRSRAPTSGARWCIGCEEAGASLSRKSNPAKLNFPKTKRSSKASVVVSTDRAVNSRPDDRCRSARAGDAAAQGPSANRAERRRSSSESSVISGHASWRRCACGRADSFNVVGFVFHCLQDPSLSYVQGTSRRVGIPWDAETVHEIRRHRTADDR
jgi:hypothetical protein